MSKLVMEYVLNIWNLWSAKDPLRLWFDAWRRIVQDCCRYTRQGWNDEEILRVIRCTREDAVIAAANNDICDVFGNFYTE